MPLHLPGTRALGLDDHIGALAPGMDADLVVLAPDATPDLAQRTARARDGWDALFPMIMLGDDRVVQEVYVGGRRVGEEVG